MHRELLRGVRGKDKLPGEFRSSQNWIGGRSPSDAIYVPPPFSELNSALSDLETYLYHPGDAAYPFLVRLALIHYQFEAIHPFLDGNGRVGRLLIILLLCDQGLLPQPLLYLSAYFERHRPAYMGHLLAVSQRGDWIPWVEFFLQGIETEAHDAITRAAQMIELQRQYRLIAQQLGRSPLLIQIVDGLFSNPVFITATMVGRYNTTFPTLQQAVDRLAFAGILVEITGQARNRVFMATKIVEILRTEEKAEEAPASPA